MKCLVQVMAASLAGVEKIDFYSFGDQKFYSKFKRVVIAAQDKHVGWIWDKIVQFRRSKTGGVQSVLDFIGTDMDESNVE